MLTKSKAVLQNFIDATQHEWIETNGLGGWSASSVIGAHTRRYHGLLVAAIVPPAERTVLLSKLDETIVVDDKRTALGCNLYAGNTIHPNGHHYLQSFNKAIFPSWIYKTDGVELRKTIAMIQGENTVVIIYDVVKSATPFTLELLPLIAARGYHSLNHEGPRIHWDASFKEGIFHNQPDNGLDVYINIPGASYEHAPRWFNNFIFSIEQYRGLDFTEDLLNHGVFSVTLKKGDSLGLIISTQDPSGRNASELLATEEKRRLALIKDQSANTLLQQLTLAADQFIAKRDENLKTVIAGYHWFTDWGRDTMISLPGLCLSTVRYDDAKKILGAFAKTVSEGMLPNRFRDGGEAPEYNNVDGTLWYFIAVYKYLQASADKKFVLGELLPVLKDIIKCHIKGTRYNIREDADGLLYSGEEGVQLTWMDAKVGDWVVTPRRGKAVEIQALWYNALLVFAELLKLNKEKKEATVIQEKALLTKQHFTEQFWNKENSYLYDVVDGDSKDASLRPNQLFAISLPFPLIEGQQAKAILEIIKEKLYTPVGLRSLSPDDPQYIGTYGGDTYHRDKSYHQGTVWSWLLGPYVDALMKTGKTNNKAKKVIANFKYHLNEAGIGSVSEIFDGNAPHHPRGCVAQAWGVAEILRVIREYDL
jgi:predicted glycogen debranching enzyme